MSDRPFSIGDRVKILIGKYAGETGIISSDVTIRPGYITCTIMLENKKTIRFTGNPSDLEALTGPFAEKTDRNSLVTLPSASNTSRKAASSAPQGEICYQLGSNQNSAEFNVGDLVQVKSPKGVWNDAILLKILPKGYSVKDKNGVEISCIFSQDSIRKQDLFRCVAIGETQEEQLGNQVICSKKDGQVSSVLPNITTDFIKFFESKGKAKPKFTSETNELLGNLKKMMSPSDKLSLGTSRETLDKDQKEIYKKAFVTCLSEAKKNDSSAKNTLLKIISTMVSKSASDTFQMLEGSLEAHKNNNFLRFFLGLSSDGTVPASLEAEFDLSLFCRKSSEGKLDDKYYILLNYHILQYFALLVTTLQKEENQSRISKFYIDNRGMIPPNFSQESTIYDIIEEILDYIKINKIILQDTFAEIFFTEKGNNILLVDIYDLIQWIETQPKKIQENLPKNIVEIIEKMKIYLRFNNVFENFLISIIPQYMGSNHDYETRIEKGQRIEIPQWLFSMFINMNLEKINKSKSEEELNLEALRTLILDLIRGHDFDIDNFETIYWMFPNLFRPDQWDFLRANLHVDRSVLEFLDRFRMPGICLMNRTDTRKFFVFECAMAAERIYDIPAAEEMLTSQSDGNFLSNVVKINEIVIAADFSTTKSVGRSLWVNDMKRTIELINKYVANTQVSSVSFGDFLKKNKDSILFRALEFCGPSAEYDSAASTVRPTIQFRSQTCMSVGNNITGNLGIAIKTQCNANLDKVQNDKYLEDLFNRICLPDFTGMWGNIPDVRSSINAIWFNQCLIKIMEIIKNDGRKGVSVVKTRALLKNIIKNLKSKEFKEYASRELLDWAKRPDINDNPELMLIELLKIYAIKLISIGLDSNASNMLLQNLMDLINGLPNKAEAQLLAQSSNITRTNTFLSQQMSMHKLLMNEQNVTEDKVLLSINECLNLFNQLPNITANARQDELLKFLKDRIDPDILEFIYDIIVKINVKQSNLGIEPIYRIITEIAQTSPDLSEGYLIQKLFGNLEFRYLLLACVVYKLKNPTLKLNTGFLDQTVGEILRSPTSDIEHADTSEFCYSQQRRSIHPELEKIVNMGKFYIQNGTPEYFSSFLGQIRFMLYESKISPQDVDNFMFMINCPNFESIPECLREYIIKRNQEFLLAEESLSQGPSPGFGTGATPDRSSLLLRSPSPRFGTFATPDRSSLLLRGPSPGFGTGATTDPSLLLRGPSPGFGTGATTDRSSLFIKNQPIVKARDQEKINDLRYDTLLRIQNEDGDENMPKIDEDEINQMLNYLMDTIDDKETIKNMTYTLLRQYIDNLRSNQRTKGRKNEENNLLSMAKTLIKSDQTKRFKKGGIPSTRRHKLRMKRFTKGRNFSKRKGTIKKTYRKKNKTRRH
jgi:hypothetical protein